jgi:hypothetical protein
MYAAIRKHGCPTALVSDHGGVFRDHRAMQIYQALGIEKKEEDSGYLQPLKNGELHHVDLSLRQTASCERPGQVAASRGVSTRDENAV